MALSLRDTILQEAHELFLARGINGLSVEDITAELDISPVTFREMFRDKDELVLEAVRHDIRRQHQEHAALYTRVANPVQRLFALLEIGIRDLHKVKSPTYVSDLIRDYPAAWETAMRNLEEYSQPQLHNLLNEGVLQKLIRADINIVLVTKVVLGMFNLILDENLFPPTRFNLAEVYRSVYLYYIRGLCTEEGERAAASYFSRL